MKREIDVPGNKLIIFYRIVVVIMLLLVVLLIGGSLYGLLRPRDSGPLFRIGGPDRGGQGGAVKEGNGAFRGGVSDGGGGPNVFSGIGTLRIQNADKTAVIIISISFPYKAEDRPFTEELASHIGEFRSIATNYFAALGVDKLTRLDEEQAKADILKQYNALLRLGGIDTLFFGDFMIVE